MPHWVKYFGDPMLAVWKYRKNALNKSKRAPGMPLGYGIAVIYSIMFGEMFRNHHNSLDDTLAQVRIFKDPRLQHTCDLKKCVTLMEEVWTGKRRKEAEYSLEPRG